MLNLAIASWALLRIQDGEGHVLDSTCPSWPHFPILLFSQWSWTSPLDTETKQIRNGCWKIRRVNPTGKKRKPHSLEWREWPKVWGKGQRPTFGRTVTGTGNESLVFLKVEGHNSTKLTLPASNILNAVIQLKKWKNFSPILVVTEDYIYFCFTGANSVVEWAVWKVPLTITDSLQVNLISKTKNAQFLPGTNKIFTSPIKFICPITSR